jgi:hypothetical protein
MLIHEILAELRKERAEIEGQLAALTEAIATFERLQNGGRRPRGRPRGSVGKKALELNQVVRQIASAGGS